jgi:16S rRNA (guanine1516-N2)-methyltransferase
MTEALRVAKKRVVLKAHYRSPLFERYGFQRMTRPNIKFHYGVVEKKLGIKTVKDERKKRVIG